MEAILLPTDFSDTSRNAALYALKLAEQIGAAKLVLYHSYEIPLTIDPITPTVQMLDIQSLKDASKSNLENLQAELQPQANGIQLDSISEYGALTAGLDEVCEKANAALIVMGITGGNLLEEKLIGSNTLSVAKNTNVPVIIIPSGTTFTPVHEVMLTGDFNKNDTNLPLTHVRRILDETKAKLFVYNVEEGNDPDISYAVHKQLDELNPEYHYSTDKHYVETINQFVKDHNIDLVITVLKKHGFFEGLFAEDHTKMLAFHSNVPLMVVHA